MTSKIKNPRANGEWVSLCSKEFPNEDAKQWVIGELREKRLRYRYITDDLNASREGGLPRGFWHTAQIDWTWAYAQPAQRIEVFLPLEAKPKTIAKTKRRKWQRDRLELVVKQLCPAACRPPKQRPPCSKSLVRSWSWAACGRGTRTIQAVTQCFEPSGVADFLRQKIASANNANNANNAK